MPTSSNPARRDSGATAYALLGLLAVRPWTAYELAQQVRRSLHWCWPRAERKLYDDPKRLVADGFATATEEFTGKRPRTVYTITGSGRRELARWLGTPSADPLWESEALVKVFFADGGDLGSLRESLAAMAETARGRLAELSRMAGETPRFPERRHLGAITVRLAQDQEETHLRWAEWALEQVASWRSVADPGSWDPETVYTPLAEAAAGDPLT
jgi:DNA-binding PadR family transcriptional regulator